MCVCVRACVRSCVCVCVSVRACMRVCVLMYIRCGAIDWSDLCLGTFPCHTYLLLLLLEDSYIRYVQLDRNDEVHRVYEEALFM